MERGKLAALALVAPLVEYVAASRSIRCPTHGHMPVRAFGQSKLGQISH